MDIEIQENNGWYIESNGAHQYTIEDLLDNFCPDEVIKEILDPKRWVDIEEWCRADDNVWKEDKNKVDQLIKLRELWTDIPESICKLYKVFFNELQQCDNLFQIATYFYSHKNESEYAQRYKHNLDSLILVMIDFAMIDIDFAKKLIKEAESSYDWEHNEDIEELQQSLVDIPKNQATHILQNVSKHIEDLQEIKRQYNAKSLFEKIFFLRNSIINNPIIEIECQKDESLSEERSILMSQINQFIKDEINQRVNEFEIINYDSSKSIDYAIAKPKLLDILRVELKSLLQGEEEHVGLMNKNMDDEYCDQIQVVIQQCVNDKYTISLVGEFQSGKTTTINALCGGKQIGTIGKGTKTSAVPLSICYGEKDKFQIIWKDKSEIQAIISTISPIWFSDNSPLSKCNFERIDIDDEKIRREILLGLEDLRKAYALMKRQGGKCIIKEKDRQNIVLCSMILKYWKSDFLNKKIGEQVIESEVANITKFPAEMIDRWWNRGGIETFKDEEVLFIFIKEIRCCCNSPFLQQLKSSVIDCPGLFASEYDTRMTEHAMTESNAILYLLPRIKGGGEQLDEYLYKLKTEYEDFDGKIFFAYNQSNIDENRESIFRDHESRIKKYYKDGYSLASFDALLAYLSLMKISYDQGLIDSDSTIINEFIQNNQPIVDTYTLESVGIEQYTKYFGPIEFKSFEEAWAGRIKQYFPKTNTVPPPELTLEISGFKKLFNLLKVSIEKNRARSILVDKGIDVLRKYLSHRRSNLYSLYVEPYTKDAKATETLWNNRKINIEYFEEEATRILRENLDGDKDWEKSLTNMEYDKMFSNQIYEDLIENICKDLYSKVSILSKLRADPQKLKEKIKKIFMSRINSCINSHFAKWENLLQTNQDKDFSYLFSRKISAIESLISNKWIEQFGEDDNLRIRLSEFYPLPYLITEVGIKRVEVNVDINDMNYKFEKTATRDKIDGWTSGIYTAAVYIGGIFSTGGLASTLALTGGGVYSWLSSRTENDFKEKSRPKVKKVIDDHKGLIYNLVNERIKNIIEQYMSARSVNMNLFDNEKVNAIANSKSLDAERNCLNAVCAIERMRASMNVYNNFVQKLNQA